MVSIIDALVSKNDIIVYDVDSHACIIDGVRLHMGKRFTYKHNDIESLEKNLTSPMSYSGALKAVLTPEILEEDMKVQDYKINVKKVTIVDSSSMFQ